jgi:hypothetical protein
VRTTIERQSFAVPSSVIDGMPHIVVNLYLKCLCIASSSTNSGASY